jgi:hypothetical protein
MRAWRGCGARSDRQHGVLTQRGAGNVSIPQEAFIAALRMGGVIQPTLGVKARN